MIELSFRTLKFLILLPLFHVIPIRSLAQELPPLFVSIYDSSATQGYYFMAPYKSFPPYAYLHPQLILDRRRLSSQIVAQVDGNEGSYLLGHS